MLLASRVFILLHTCRATKMSRPCKPSTGMFMPCTWLPRECYTGKLGVLRSSLTLRLDQKGLRTRKVFCKNLPFLLVLLASRASMLTYASSLLLLAWLRTWIPLLSRVFSFVRLDSGTSFTLVDFFITLTSVTKTLVQVRFVLALLQNPVPIIKNILNHSCAH